MKHQTVLLEETIDGLNLKKADTAIDATVGLGGHAEELAQAVGEKGTVLMIDADRASLESTRERLKDAKANLIYINGNFRNLTELAHNAGITKAHGIVFDLGWHSGQLEAGKGLSFKADEPLDMRLSSRGPSLGITAADIIADWDEDDLATLFREYGEERFAGRIARVIVETRKKAPIETTVQLVAAITSAVPAFYRRGRIHCATRTFQALRIAVNDELEALKEGVAAAIDLLAPAGRVAVISFHSLEDRIVKQAFRAAEDAGAGERVTKKPLVPTRAESVRNPRARSGKLRIFEKKHA
jgi:16S rRNA (cytosine1402-N4)-methyltransferase